MRLTGSCQKCGDDTLVCPTCTLKALRDAVRDEGPQPRFHRETMARHRREWPTLWKAIDDLLRE